LKEHQREVISTTFIFSPLSFKAFTTSKVITENAKVAASISNDNPTLRDEATKSLECAVNKNFFSKNSLPGLNPESQAIINPAKPGPKKALSCVIP